MQVFTYILTGHYPWKTVDYTELLPQSNLVSSKMWWVSKKATFLFSLYPFSQFLYILIAMLQEQILWECDWFYDGGFTNLLDIREDILLLSFI